MNFKTVVLILAAASGLAEAKLFLNTSMSGRSCSNKRPLMSCSASLLSSLNDVDSCCSETKGGLILATQFWDTYTGLEESGQLLPKHSWTLHGLWPDFCDGSFTQYCDFSRQYDPTPSPPSTNGTKVPEYKGPGVDTFIKDFNRTDLLKYMNNYWVSWGSPNENFWAHEFSKHGTCYSTFDIPCYGPNYKKHEDVIEFFETAIKYYERLPTYHWLAAEGIKPSNSTPYSLSNITSALEKHFGAKPYLGCSGPAYNATKEGAHTNDHGRTVLSEVWYFNHVTGRIQDANATHINSTTPTSCSNSTDAIWYYERTPTSERKPKV